MGDQEQMLNDAKNIAKNLFESILNEVMRIIMEQSDSCDGSNKEIKVENCVKKEVLSCVKEELFVKSKDLEIQDAFLKDPHLSEVSYPSFTNLPDVCIQSSTLSIPKPHGEGDPMQQVTCFYQLGSEINISASPHNNEKIISTSSPNSDSSHNEILDKLHESLNKISFDDIDSEITNDNEMIYLDSIKLSELEESLNADLMEEIDNQCTVSDSCDDLEYISNNENLSLRKSRKFWHCNNTEYFPASTDQLSPNFCELVGMTNEHGLEDKKDIQVLKIISENNGVNNDTKINYSVDTSHSTNPFRNPFLCSTSPSMIDLSPTCSPNTPLNSNTFICCNGKESDMDLISIENDETVEKTINIVEPEYADEMGNDIFQTRTYWSNTGLIIENKINRKSVYSLPDSVGIESIRSATPVKEVCLKLNNQESNLQLASSDITSQNNGDYAKDSKVNYLSFPNKSDKKKKKSFVSRFTSTISNIFGLKKSAPTEVKN